jgi:hypothetical protein
MDARPSPDDLSVAEPGAAGPSGGDRGSVAAAARAGAKSARAPNTINWERHLVRTPSGVRVATGA